MGCEEGQSEVGLGETSGRVIELTIARKGKLGVIFFFWGKSVSLEREGEGLTLLFVVGVDVLGV